MDKNSSFETLYAVELECDSCVDSVSKVLSNIKGVDSYNIDLKNQLVSIKGSVAPSVIVKSIKDTGRDIIVRGTGQPNSAAVCILESHNEKDYKSPIFGLVRMICPKQAQSETEKGQNLKSACESVLFDITLSGLKPGNKYLASIRSSGDISKGLKSTGDPIDTFPPLVADTKGEVQAFYSRNGSLWELIGHAMAVTSTEESKKSLSNQNNLFDKEEFLGVIARSAGIWENNKTVCSCSGKTVWEERKDQVRRGLKA